MVYTITRCSRPSFLTRVLTSIKESSDAAGIEQLIALLLIDDEKVSDADAFKAVQDVDIAAYIRHFDPVPGDRYLVGAMNTAIQEDTLDNAWCLVVDDDDQVLPGAFRAIKANPDAELLIWNANNPCAYRSVVNDVHDLAPGRCIGHAGWSNIAFKAHLAKKHKLKVSNGTEDGYFLEACLADGVKPVYTGEVGYYYIPAVEQQKQGLQ